MDDKNFGTSGFKTNRELRMRNFPIQGINMIKHFQKQVQLSTNNSKYSYREALYDMIEYAYVIIVEKKMRKR